MKKQMPVIWTIFSAFIILTFMNSAQVFCSESVTEENQILNVGDRD